MSDLISRQETIKAALEYQVEYCGAAFDIKMQEGMIKKLKDIPSAYPKKGKWIVFAVDDARGRRTGRHMLICNQCHSERELEYGEKMPKFCGNCGADMRESE